MVYVSRENNNSTLVVIIGLVLTIAVGLIYTRLANKKSGAENVS
ncbi:hypothetical protein [Morganella morganii]